jgi:hypothetical protein
MPKIKLSRKVLAKDGVDEEGKDLKDMELYEDTIEYDLPEHLTAESPQVIGAIAKDVGELLEKLFEVKIDVTVEEPNTFIVPDKTIKLPPGFKVRNADINYDGGDSSVN